MLKLVKTIKSLLNRIIIFVPQPQFIYRKLPVGYYRLKFSPIDKKQLRRDYVLAK